MQRIATWAAILIFAGLLGFGIRGCELFYPQTTLTSISPDDNLRVTLSERGAFIDRNFDLRLGEAKIRVIFRSPDEGRPTGSERIIWSADGSRFLLLGRHFFTIDSSKLASGEKAYLMMDVPSGKIWCNASQQSTFPPFTIDDLRKISWFGWTPD